MIKPSRLGTTKNVKKGEKINEEKGRKRERKRKSGEKGSQAVPRVLMKL